MNKKGFTLIEVLLAVTIIAVLSGFVIVQMNGAANATKDTKRKADIDLIKNAIISYRSENYSNAPVDDCEIGGCSTLNTALTPFLATLPDDPDSDKNYVYESNGTDCTLYATLSDGSIYRYQCDTNEVSNIFPVDGVCGEDDGDTLDYTSTPTALCNSGTASAIVGSGPWYWSCSGENEGSSATCWAKLSDVFACNITNGTCSGTDIFHLYDTAGGHAEMNNQSGFSYKLCCTGGGIIASNITNTDECPTNSATILKLYSTTNSHVEKGIDTENDYTNKICLSATGKTATCLYQSTCSTGYVEMVSISDGDTSLHVGDTGIFATKVCCKVTSY